MKRRTKRPAAAALTALAVLAGTAVTGSTAAAQTQTPTFNPLQGFTMEALNNALKGYCENEWYTSPASGTCDFRFGGITAEYPNCIVRAHCRQGYGGGNHLIQYVPARWRGLLADIDDLRNCNGALRRSC